ncbi:MAG: hypothetical protein J6J17_00885 [Bacilli bacterium]|nr:hypothetical protein [Bacilli bacterium]
MNIAKNKIKEKLSLKKQLLFVNDALKTDDANKIYETFCESTFLTDPMKDHIIKRVCYLECVDVLINFSEFVGWITENNKNDLFNKILEIGEYRHLRYFMNIIEWISDDQRQIINCKLESLNALKMTI